MIDAVHPRYLLSNRIMAKESVILGSVCEKIPLFSNLVVLFFM